MADDEKLLVKTVAAIFLITALLIAIAFMAAPAECKGATDGMRFQHRWKAFGGCQIRMDNGDWIPLGNYRVIP